MLLSFQHSVITRRWCRTPSASTMSTGALDSELLLSSLPEPLSAGAANFCLSHICTDCQADSHGPKNDSQCVCMCACMPRMYAYVCMCACACVCMYVYACMYVCVYAMHVCLCVHVCLCMCLYVCLYMYVCVRVCHACMCVCMCVCASVCSLTAVAIGF